jgi:pyruvate/2-oxoglutarate dehydrogenase complex dihydrolipoamide acyltransferase (E2) component
VLKRAGEVVNVGDVIGFMEAKDGAAAPAARPAPKAAPEPEPEAPARRDGVETAPPLLTQLPGRAEEEAPPAPKPAPAPERPAPRRAGATDVAQHLPAPEVVKASPSVRRTLLEQGIDPKSLAASGPGGFITHGDLGRREQQMPVAGSRAEERVKMTPLTASRSGSCPSS